MRAQRLLAALVGFSMVFALTSCQTEKSLPEQKFDLRGKVIGIDKGAGTVRLQHEAIPNYMAAMTMDYPVKDKWVFDVLKIGQTVRATLVVATDRAWLEGVVVAEEAKPQEAATAPAAQRDEPDDAERRRRTRAAKRSHILVRRRPAKRARSQRKREATPVAMTPGLWAWPHCMGEPQLQVPLAAPCR